MANQFGYPTTEATARRILRDRKIAIEEMQNGQGSQNELSDLEFKNAVAARRFLAGVTTAVERKQALAYAIARGFLMASIPITARAHEIFPRTKSEGPSPKPRQ